MNRVFNFNQKGEYCIAAKNVINGEKIYCFYKQRPIEQNDSGLRFFGRDIDTNDVEMVEIKSVLELNNAVCEYLDCVPGCIYEYKNHCYVQIKNNSNLKRLINKVYSRVGKIDFIHNCDYNIGVINDKKMFITLIPSQFFESQFYINFNKVNYDLYLKIIKDVCKSGASKSDIVLFDQRQLIKTVIINESKYGNWLYQITPLDKNIDIID